MLKRRLIPKLQLRTMPVGEQNKAVLVTTQRFDRETRMGDPVSQAKIFQAQSADELLFLGLDARAQGVAYLCDIIERVAEEVFMPLTVGGGIRRIEEIGLLLRAGADKVSINSSALEDPSILRAAADRFGSQCIVASIDYRVNSDGSTIVHSDGGRVPTKYDATRWAVCCAAAGAGEILLTCIDRDGTLGGLDLVHIREVAKAVDIPVIAAGGCGTATHFVEGFLTGAADAIAAGTFFSRQDQTPLQLRAHIRNAGIAVRMAP